MFISTFLRRKPPVPEDAPVAKEQIDDINKPQQGLAESETLNDSLQQLQNQEKYGTLAGAAAGEAQSLQFENDNLIVRFSTKGGALEYVELKDYQTYYGEPLVILDNESNTQEMLVNTDKGVIDLFDLYFQTKSTGSSVSGEDTLQITFSIPLGNGYIRHVYSLPGTGYELGYALENGRDRKHPARPAAELQLDQPRAAYRARHSGKPPPQRHQLLHSRWLSR